MSQVACRWLLSVLGPVFELHVRFDSGWWRGGAAGVPGGTGFHVAGMGLLPCRRDNSRWSARRRQDAEPVPAGEEGIVPGPVRADLEDPLAGVADEPGGQVPDPVASLN